MLPPAMPPHPRTAAALALLLAAAARADPPPPLRCSASGSARVAPPAHTSAFASALATHAGGAVVLLRALLREPRRPPVTALYVQEFSSNREPLGPLREVARVPAGPAARVAVLASGAARRALLRTPRGWYSVRFSSDAAAAPEAPEALRPPERSFGDPALLASGAELHLLWHRPGAARWQRFSLAPEAPSRVVRLPAGAVPAALALASSESLALALRTAQRRVVLALQPWEGSLRMAPSPAPCTLARCPTPALRAGAEGALVAGWTQGSARDGLLWPFARSLDAELRPRGSALEGFPVAHPLALAGAQGQALLLQLGRPAVLRGTTRAVALAPAPREGDFARDAELRWEGSRAWVSQLTRRGELLVGTLECAAP